MPISPPWVRSYSPRILEQRPWGLVVGGGAEAWREEGICPGLTVWSREKKSCPWLHPEPASSQSRRRVPVPKLTEGFCPAVIRKPVLLETRSQRAEGLAFACFSSQRSAHLGMGEEEESGEVTTRREGGEQVKDDPHRARGQPGPRVSKSSCLVPEQPGPPHHPAQPAQAAGRLRAAGLQRHLVAVRRYHAASPPQFLRKASR